MTGGTPMTMETSICHGNVNGWEIPEQSGGLLTALMGNSWNSMGN